MNRFLLTASITFERAFAEFLDSRQISEQRRRLYVSLSNTFGRYLHYRSLSHKMNSFSSATIQDFAHYLKNENAIMIENGMLRKGMKTYLRGVNTVNDLMRKLRTFSAGVKTGVTSKVLRSPTITYAQIFTEPHII